MEGEGVFAHPDKDEFVGTFKNNYYYKDGHFINPFLEESHTKFIQRKRSKKMAHDSKYNENNFVFRRDMDTLKIYEHIQESNSHNRISIVISSK